MTDTPKIELRENGPLIAKNIPNLRGAVGDHEVKDVMALCRCGASKNKPFCDGSHTAAGFVDSGGKPEGPDRLFKYEGTDATVFFNPRLCSHAAECGRIAVNVFNPAQKPWVQPDNGTIEEINAVVQSCPSGALSMADADGTPTHQIADRPEIIIQKDGPYWVTGPLVAADLQGENMTREKYVLCRCGKSGNKPYCDGTHRDAKWRDDAET